LLSVIGLAIVVFVKKIPMKNDKQFVAIPETPATPNA